MDERGNLLIRHSHRPSALRAAAIAFAFGTACLSGAPAAHAQLNQDGQISTEGTQFVRPPVAPAVPAAAAPVAPEVPQPPAPVVPQPQIQQVQGTPVPAGTPQGQPTRFPSVVILLDTSDSMLDKSPGKKLSHLDEARNAIAEVIRDMAPETRVQVWHFNQRMYPIQVGTARPGTFTAVGNKAQRDELISKLRSIRTSGQTNLYESLVKALDFFSVPADQPLYRSGQRFPVLVVVSDGEDSGVSRVTLDQVLAAERTHPLVTVASIGFTVARDDVWFKTLCKIASRPDGCATADDQAQLNLMLDTFYRPAVAAR